MPDNSGQPICSDYGQGWEGTYPNCTYAPSDSSGLDVESLGFGEELEGSTLAEDWQKYFDAYDPTKETMLTEHANIDVGQLGASWGLQSQQLGEGYQQQLGGLFDQAGTGMMGLMESWAGAGQTMSGRKGRQRKALGRDTARQAGSYGLSLSQARATGALGVQQATTDIYQGLESDIYGARESWEQQQRSNLNTLLGMGIWPGDDDDDDNPPPPPSCSSPGQIRCADGSCQSYDDSPGNPCDNYGGEEGAGDSSCQPPAGGCPPTEYWQQNTCTCEWIP